MATSDTRVVSTFIRGFAVGAFTIACILGPDWLAVQVQSSHFNAWHAGLDDSWRHVADLLGLVDFMGLFARALIGPLRQWFALGWLAVRLLLMLGVVALLGEPLGALLRALAPSWAQRGGSRGLAQSAWLGLVVSASILLGALFILSPIINDASTPIEQPHSCRFAWAGLGGGACHHQPPLDSSSAAPPTAVGFSLVHTVRHSFFTAFERLQDPRAGRLEPLERLALQMALGLLLVPASLLGDLIDLMSPLSPASQARLRRVLTALPAVAVAPFAVVPTWRLLVAAWEIRFRHRVLSDDLTDVRSAHQLAAVELDALADLLFYRAVAQTVALIVRVLLLRPDAFHLGLRMLGDDVAASLTPGPASTPLRRRLRLRLGRLLPLFYAVCLTPLATLLAAVSRALACAPPTHVFWHATALAIEASTTDRWLMVLLPSAAIGVRLLADGSSALLPRSSVHRRRIIGLVHLGMELIGVQCCLYPAALFALSPVLVAAGFRGTGSLHQHTTLSIPTIPPRSAVLCCLPSLLAVAARSAELRQPGITHRQAPRPLQQGGSPSPQRKAESLEKWMFSPSERSSEDGGDEIDDISEREVEGEEAEQPADAVESANWWLLGLLHLMRGPDDGGDWSASQRESHLRREREREDARMLGTRGQQTAEGWVRRHMVRMLPSELRDPVSRLLCTLAAPLINGQEAAAVRDSALRVLSELLSTALSFKLLTRTGRHQLRRGLHELLAQQENTRPPASLRLNAASVQAVCDWLKDPAIGIGGVLRPPPDEVPAEHIQPPPGSEHDVDYSRDTIGLLLGGTLTREAQLSLFLDLAGGTFFHLGGLALRVSINERDANAGTSGLQLRLRWEPPHSAQKRHGRLGALRIEAELEQPGRVTLDLRGLSIFNATLGSMPLKGPVRIAGKGGRIRAAVTLVLEGGAALASCADDELPEHVREHGGGVFLTLEKLRIEDSGFELDEASRLIWDELLDGSGYLLSALRLIFWNYPLVASLYPQAKAAWGAISSTFSAVTGLGQRKIDGPDAPGSPSSPGVAATRSLHASLSMEAFGEESIGAPSASGHRATHRSRSTRLIDDILRLIGDASCANNQNRPLLTWSVLEAEAPELTAFLSSAARRQEARDERHAAEAARVFAAQADLAASPSFVARTKSLPDHRSPTAIMRAKSYASQLLLGSPSTPSVPPPADVSAPLVAPPPAADLASSAPILSTPNLSSPPPGYAMVGKVVLRKPGSKPESKSSGSKPGSKQRESPLSPSWREDSNRTETESSFRMRDSQRE